MGKYQGIKQLPQDDALTGQNRVEQDRIQIADDPGLSVKTTPSEWSFGPAGRAGAGARYPVTDGL